MIKPGADVSKNAAIIVMGVCGVGKSHIANLVAEVIGAPMVEADNYHTDESKSKMAVGIALSDEDRFPWLDKVATAANSALENNVNVVIACSALRHSYRARLIRSLPSCLFIHLTGPQEVIEERLANRQGHFAGVKLLQSQLTILEDLSDDENGFSIDISPPAEDMLKQIMEKLETPCIKNPDASSTNPTHTN